MAPKTRSAVLKAEKAKISPKTTEKAKKQPAKKKSKTSTSNAPSKPTKNTKKQPATSQKASVEVSEDLQIIEIESDIVKIEKIEKEEAIEQKVVVSEVLDEKSSSSSSSGEDSDDEFEAEKFRSERQRIERDWSSDDSDDEVSDQMSVKDIESQIEKKTKKRRILIKKQKQMKYIPDDDEIICEYEPKTLPKERKRRLYRRKMMRAPGVPKRRRMKRKTLEIDNLFTCDTLTHFRPDVKALTTPINWKYPDIDRKALGRLFRGLDLDHDHVELSGNSEDEEDEADIIMNDLNVYETRNSNERKRQIAELKIDPFAEKLASHNGPKALHGSAQSSITSYHPEFFVSRRNMKLPKELDWDKPFTHLIYQRNLFDPDRECTNFLNRAAEEKKTEQQKSMMDQIRQKVRERLQFRQSETVGDQYPEMEEDDDFPQKFGDPDDDFDGTFLEIDDGDF